MKTYVIASTEYEANMPDLFLMDENGNYYGVSEHSYAAWRNYPASVEYWIHAEGSDSGRFFNIDEVEANQEDVMKFDYLTKEYYRLGKDIDRLDEERKAVVGDCPCAFNFKSRKAYNMAWGEYIARLDEYNKNHTEIRDCMVKRSQLWKDRTKLFLTFSKKVAEAISDNENISRNED